MKPKARHQAVIGEHLESLGLPLANLDAPDPTVEQVGHDTIAACVGVPADAAVAVNEHGSSHPSAGFEGVSVFLQKRTNRLRQIWRPGR